MNRTRLQGLNLANPRSGDFSLGFGMAWSGFLIAYRSKVQDPPYIGGRVPGFTTNTESHLDTESYSRSWPSKLELRVVLGLLPDRFLLHHGPWSAYLQPSPCNLKCDPALAFLVLAGLLFGSMGLPIKYPPITTHKWTWRAHLMERLMQR